jgi:UDP-N-acetylmuramoyl-tripeptide--D-alanyl-D-alanine ligase
VKLLNDSYNANPAAMKVMLVVLRETPAARRIAVLGEMRELGDDAPRLHREVGRAVANSGCDALVAVSGQASELVRGAVAAGMDSRSAHFFEDADAAGDFAAALLRPGDAVLFKASRAIGMERAFQRVLEHLRAEGPQSEAAEVEFNSPERGSVTRKRLANH